MSFLLCKSLHIAILKILEQLAWAIVEDYWLEMTVDLVRGFDQVLSIECMKGLA